MGHPFMDARGLYRVFNAAEYRYRWNNTRAPSLIDPIDETKATLDLETAATFADGIWRFAATFFNGIYDSGFLPVGPFGEPYLILTIESGVIIGNPSQKPDNWSLRVVGTNPTAFGVVWVDGFYTELGSLRADEWYVEYSVDRASWSSVTQAVPVVGVAVLRLLIPVSWDDGSEVFVRVRMRRDDGAGWIFSEGIDDVRSIVVDGVGPTAPLGGDQFNAPLSGVS
jgi:hypothetical protein